MTLIAQVNQKIAETVPPLAGIRGRVIALLGKSRNVRV
jgi:hypothetical protein